MRATEIDIPTDHPDDRAEFTDERQDRRAYEREVRSLKPPRAVCDPAFPRPDGGNQAPDFACRRLYSPGEAP